MSPSLRADALPHQPGSLARPAPAVLRVRGLSVRYGGVQALSKVDLHVCAGEVVAVIGPNGAGKSTLFNAMSGHAGEVEGTLEVGGAALAPSLRHRLGARVVVALVALFAALASANLEQVWAQSINETFRLHCDGRDTRGCTIAWSDAAKAAYSCFAGGPQLVCVETPQSACGAVGVRVAASGEVTRYPTLADARAALPAAWQQASVGRASNVATTLSRRALVGACCGMLAAWILNRQLGRVRQSATALARAGVARTFQNLRIFAAMTVADNVRVALAAGRDYGRANLAPTAATLAQINAGENREENAPPAALTMDAAADDAAALSVLLARVELTHLADVPASALSYGEMRRLEIARALATRPRILLLDEPAAGMNAQETQAILTLVRAVKAEGIAVLLIEHDMPLVMGISDRVVVLEYGQKIADATPEQVRCDPRVIRAYLGASADAATVARTATEAAPALPAGASPC